MEYLDFELPIKELEDQLQKCKLIGEESDVDVTETCENLEKKLVSLLSIEGMEETIITINKIIRNDYQMGKIRSMNGWVLSEIEFSLLILRNQYV